MNIRIPELRLAYNHLTECPQYVMNCRSKDQHDVENFYCSAEGMVFYTANCQELKRGRSTKEIAKGKEGSKGIKANMIN